MIKQYLQRLFLNNFNSFKFSQPFNTKNFLGSSNGFLTNSPLKPVEINIHDFKDNKLIESGKFFEGDPYVFKITPRNDIFHEIYVWERSCIRAGNACVRNRGETHFSRRKLRPQKGSGRARIGDRGAPHLHKGGKAHPPKPQNFGYNLPKKIIKIGLRMGLTLKHEEKKFYLFEKINDYKIFENIFDLNKELKFCLIDLNFDESKIDNLTTLKNVSVIHLFNLKVSDFLKHNVFITTTECLTILQKYLLFDKIPQSNHPMYYELLKQHKILDKCFRDVVSPPEKTTPRIILYKGQRKPVYTRRYDLNRKYYTKHRLAKGLGARG